MDSPESFNPNIPQARSSESWHHSRSTIAGGGSVGSITQKGQRARASRSEKGCGMRERRVVESGSEGTDDPRTVQLEAEGRKLPPTAPLGQMRHGSVPVAHSATPTLV